MTRAKHAKPAVALPVTGGGQILVDPDIAEILRRRRIWWAGPGYARTSWQGKRRYIHQLVCPAPPGNDVDHINHDKSDNRRANLRAVSHQRNIWNMVRRALGRSGWRGVHQGAGQRFEARLEWSRQRHRLWGFANPLIAAFCRDDLAQRITGLREGLNFSAFLKRRDLRGFLTATDGKLFSIVFVRRRDGRARTMVCRTGVTKQCTGAGLAFEPAGKNLFGVYDIRKRAYRFIPLENVLCLTFNRKRYRVIGAATPIAA